MAFEVRKLRQEMQDAIPKFYEESRIVANKLDKEASEWELINFLIKDLLDQFFIDTATWALAIYERDCGLLTDENKPLSERRSKIKSKLRGVGVVTKDLIKSVAEAYINGEVDVSENFSTCEIVITFIGKRGVPSNIDDVKKAISDIIPAHLYLAYKFTYLFWSELSKASWNQIENITFDQLEVSFIN